MSIRPSLDQACQPSAGRGPDSGTAELAAPCCLECTCRRETNARMGAAGGAVQVWLVWEGLLAGQPCFQDGLGRAALRGLIARRLGGKTASTRAAAACKRVLDTGEGRFVMWRVRCSSLPRFRSFHVVLFQSCWRKTEVVTCLGN